MVSINVETSMSNFSEDDDMLNKEEKTEEQKKEDDKINIKGMMYGLIGALTYSLSQPIFKIIYLKYSSISPYEVNYLMSLIMLTLNYLFVKSNGAFILDLPRKYHRLILLRAFCGFLGYVGLVSSVKYLPVSTASCMYFTSPIWAAVLAFIFLKEKVSKFDLI